MSTLVRHVMTEAPQTLRPTMTAEDAAGLMASYDIGSVPVVDGDELLGIVTDRDLVVRVLASREDPSKVPLRAIATTTLITVTPDTRISEAREMMRDRRVRRLPVVKADRLVGIVSLGDIAVADPSRRAVGDTIERISESPATIAMNEGPPIGSPHR
jgi:CBS domain-containing protein